MKYGAVYISTVAYSCAEMLGIMILKNYKDIYVPSTDPEATFPSSNLSFWWFMAAGGLLCNVIYSAALLTGLSFVPFDRKKKVVPFLCFAGATAVYSYKNFFAIYQRKNAVVATGDLVIHGIEHLLPPISMVFQTLIPLTFPNSIPSKYY